MRPALAAVLLLLPRAAAAAPAAKCVQIYYDAVPGAEKPYRYGRVHALALQNLLGHFPRVQQRVIPIERYEKGQLDRCAASFYLGTYFDNPVPLAFRRDFVATRRTVVWAGYNVWQLPPPDLARLWGARYAGLTGLDASVRDARGRPTFYRLFDYKGQTFEKYGEFDAKEPARFDAAYELTRLELASPRDARSVRCWARHDGRPDAPRVPYALARRGRWFVADSPFSYITEEDRYLVFADLLFDILGEAPRRPPGAPKPALFRVEDVHPLTPGWQVRALADMLARERVPYAVSVIPVWVDALGTLRLRRRSRAAGAPFGALARYAAERGASFVFHGVTHARGFARNPFTGISGDDFEFWDRVRNGPVAGDSVRGVVERLEDGWALLERAGIRPVAWETPHYQASPLDSVVFGSLFRWSVGRAIYFPPGGARVPRLPAALEMTASGASGAGRRLPYLAGARAPAPEGLPAGQFYPYEIYGDVYGQRLVPENVGNLQPYMNEQVLKSVSVDDMIRILRRDAVLRDAWGSFFIHPSMLDVPARGGAAAAPGDTRELERLVAAARGAGYEFIDLRAWTRAHDELRPAPIEVLP